MYAGRFLRDLTSIRNPRRLHIISPVDRCKIVSEIDGSMGRGDEMSKKKKKKRTDEASISCKRRIASKNTKNIICERVRGLLFLSINQLKINWQIYWNRTSLFIAASLFKVTNTFGCKKKV